MLRESFDQWLLAGKKVNFIFALNESLVFVRTRNGTPEKSLRRNH